MKALELDPHDAYAKKGIAWIVYSYEKNADEALRILNATTSNYYAPDYHLLKAEIAEFVGKTIEKEKNINLYKSKVKDSNYGSMYAKYNVALLAESKATINSAIAIAQREITERPTIQSYDLLAWSLYKNGNLKKRTLHLLNNASKLLLKMILFLIEIIDKH